MRMLLFNGLSKADLDCLRMTFGESYELLNEMGFATFWRHYATLDEKGRRHIQTVAQVLVGEKNNG